MAFLVFPFLDILLPAPVFFTPAAFGFAAAGFVVVVGAIVRFYEFSWEVNNANL